MSTELLNKAADGGGQGDGPQAPEAGEGHRPAGGRGRRPCWIRSSGAARRRSGSPQVWEAIEAVISRAELRAAVATVNEMVPPGTEAGADDWRAGLVGRFTTVSGFVKLLHRRDRVRRQRRRAASAGRDDRAAGRPGLPHPAAAGVTGAGRADRAAGGAGTLAAAGVRPPRPPGQVGGPARLHALRAGAVLAGTSSAGRSTPMPPPDGATRRPVCWPARRGSWSGTTC